MHEPKLKESYSHKVSIESIDETVDSRTINFLNLLNGKEIADFNLIHFVVNPGAKSVLDQHKSKEYWFIISGEGRLEINGKSTNVKSGEVFFFDSMVTHEIWNASKESKLEIFSIWW